MPERIAELTAALAGAERAIITLSETVDVHQSTLRRVKFAFALLLTLTALVGVGLYGVYHNQDRINHLQTALQVETERNKSSQCAMIALFLQFEPRTISNPSYTEEQRALQAQAYASLKDNSNKLGCMPR
jgi:hypothetical protein